MLINVPDSKVRDLLFEVKEYDEKTGSIKADAVPIKRGDSVVNHGLSYTGAIKDVAIVVDAEEVLDTEANE